MPLEELKEFVSEEDILTLYSTDVYDHPLLYYLDADAMDSTGYFNYTKENTFCAIRRLLSLDNPWLMRQKRKVLDVDRNNASAALGEIRCYENLIEAFGKEKVAFIHAKSDKHTSDIAVNNEDETVYVEINTVQMNGKEAEALENFYKETPKNPERVQIREHVSRPFGISKGCTASEKAIYKIADIKRDSSQFSKDKPSVLWVDLQDPQINHICSNLYNLSSVRTRKGIGFQSNLLWYALYAEKDMPIFENVSLDSNEGIKVKELPKMKLDGKFAVENSAQIDAVVYSGPDATVLCENPFSSKPLPLWFVEGLMSVKWFAFESSRTNMPSGQLKSQLEIDRSIIKELSKKTFYRW